MKKRIIIGATLMLAVVILSFSSCGTPSWENPDLIDSAGFADFDNSTKSKIDKIISFETESKKSNFPDDDNFWCKYIYLQGVAYAAGCRLENDEDLNLTDDELGKAKKAIMDYYQAEVEKEYNKYDEHFIPTKSDDVKVEYLSNDNFRDVRVKISYNVKEEPTFISAPDGDYKDHFIGLKVGGSNHIPYYIDETYPGNSYKRMQVLIYKPGEKIDDRTYEFETTLPGRDYKENAKNKRDFAWCDFSVIDVVKPVVYEGRELGEIGSRKRSYTQYDDIYNPTKVIISANGKNIDIDDK